MERGHSGIPLQETCCGQDPSCSIAEGINYPDPNHQVRPNSLRITASQRYIEQQIISITLADISTTSVRPLDQTVLMLARLLRVVNRVELQVLTVGRRCQRIENRGIRGNRGCGRSLVEQILDSRPTLRHSLPTILIYSESLRSEPASQP
jgi:hypothetical protein